MRKYKKVRIVCHGKIKKCEFCRDLFTEGYCKLCGSPLWKSVNEDCNKILGYYDGDLKKQGNIDFICRDCHTVTTI